MPEYYLGKYIIQALSTEWPAFTLGLKGWYMQCVHLRVWHGSKGIKYRAGNVGYCEKNWWQSKQMQLEWKEFTTEAWWKVCEKTLLYNVIMDISKLLDFSMC